MSAIPNNFKPINDDETLSMLLKVYGEMLAPGVAFVVDEALRLPHRVPRDRPFVMDGERDK